MKILLTIAVAAISSNAAIAHSGINCEETEHGYGASPGWTIIEKSEAIKHAPLFEGGKIVCVISSTQKTYEKELTHKETGKLNNISYQIYYSDGSGSIQGSKDGDSSNDWGISCNFDKIDDKKWCQLQKKELTIGIWKDRSSYVLIGKDHYPSSSITIRIDKATPIITPEKRGFNNAQTKQILAALKTGKTAVTRYQEWPYKSNIDEEIDLYGFAEAWLILNKVYETISAP